jgi:uncharacterized protein involved in response to NO
MFLAGALAVLVSMAWWALTWSAGYFGWLGWPAAPVPPGWAHAVFTQYGMLGPFILGFLLTVFPRWLDQPNLTRAHYVPVFVGVFGGYLLAHVGLLGPKSLLIAGLLLMLAGWAAALFALRGALTGKRDQHALSCYAALVLGFVGLGAFLAFVLGAPWWLANLSIKLGTSAFLLPVFFTVLHRLVPFFSGNVVGASYRRVKPAWSLPLLWIMLLLRLGLELSHRSAWLWIADMPLLCFFLGHGLAWQPWKCLRPGLLLAIHLAFAWLPVAFALLSVQSLALLRNGESILGRAPVHALTVGFFGSMMVAMVTRVTQGHAGRPLEMGFIPWLTFGLLQVVALVRIFAEIAPNVPLWLTIAAFGWLIAFAPWVCRALWIYVTPRADGKPG